eukprot:gene10621-11565_t
MTLMMMRRIRWNKLIPRQFCGVRYLSDGSPSRFADFGFKEVSREEKEKLVRGVFSSVASKYDIMNDFMSLGTHRLWKDEFVNMIGYEDAAKVDPDYIPRHLDVAGGTGDIAFRSALEMNRLYGSNLQTAIQSNQYDKVEDRPIVVCDINPEMLAVGRSRAAEQVGQDKVNMLGFIEGNAEKLPFPDNSFDLYTIAFGLRNVTNKDVAIREAFRVLKKGGRIMILEFSHVPNSLISQVYDQFSFQIIPKIGKMVANDEASYQYLVESIRRFPKQEELLKMLSNEGFSCCNYVNFTFGVVAVHSGFKL